MKVSRGFVAGVMLMLAGPVCAQSLGDLAKKEQERRKAVPPATKTFTNEDLKKIYVPPGAVTAPTAEPQAADKDAKETKDAAAAKEPGATGDEAKAGAAADSSAKDETYWRGRMTAAREELRRNQVFREALQVRINSLSADFANRDDPYQRAQIADDRQKALAELARLDQEIANGTKQIADIEDEARRAGVPAGWVR